MAVKQKARSARTFYRTVVQVEILSDDPLPDDLELMDIAESITTGDCSGSVHTVAHNQPKNGKAMAKLLRDQNSDPGFFGLTEDGEDDPDFLM